MNVWLDNSIFEKGDKLQVANVFNTFTTQGHRILLVDNSRESPAKLWIASLDGDMKDRCEYILNKSVTEVVHQHWELNVVVNMEKSNIKKNGFVYILLDHMAHWLQRPISILVENSLNDGAFIKSKAFEAEKLIIETALKNNRLKFEHGGGIDQMLVSLNGLESLTPEAFLCFVVHDSDMMLPNYISQTALKLAELCKDIGIKSYRLKRRAAENYLTLGQLHSWVMRGKGRNRKSRLRKFEAFKALCDKQRSCYAMREGFRKDRNSLKNEKKSLAEWKDFYSSVEPRHMIPLENGFGSIQCLFEMFPARESELEKCPHSKEIREEIVNQILCML